MEILKGKCILQVLGILLVFSVLAASFAVSLPDRGRESLIMGSKSAGSTAPTSSQPLTHTVKIVLLSNDRGWIFGPREYEVYESGYELPTYIITPHQILDGSEGVRILGAQSASLDLPFVFEPRGTLSRITQCWLSITHDFLGNTLQGGLRVGRHNVNVTVFGVGPVFFHLEDRAAILPEEQYPIGPEWRCHRVYYTWLEDPNTLGITKGLNRMKFDIYAEIPDVYIYEINLFLEYEYFR